MASLNPCTTPANDTADGDLPLDVLWEVLLRLSAKELCRLRVVCRLWRSITSNRDFIAAHTAHHPGPLLVGALDDAAVLTPKSVDIVVMDSCGNVIKRIHNVVKQIHNISSHRLLPTRLDLVCIEEMSTYRISELGSYNINVQVDVLNPATGAVHTLPMNMAGEYHDSSPTRDLVASYTIGQVATGEYKVLRILRGIFKRVHPEYEQIIEVLTLSTNSPMQWRAKKGPSNWVSMGDFRSVVVMGMAYFLLHEVSNGGAKQGCLAPFDLKTEEWILSCLQGPISSHHELNGMNNMLNLGENGVRRTHLTELNGFLVVAQQMEISSSSYLDLWCLMDLEKRIWERKYRIPLGMINWDSPFIVPYSLALQDGRILIFLVDLRRRNIGFGGPCISPEMQIFDPKTNTLGPVMMNSQNFHGLGIYTGSLLSIRNGDNL